ncbi:beta-glucosidase family protein [Tessaracoccus defluvii]|uniref:Glycoside hydrolase family 3 C-terminal domain-containing protein n=1 Tax=Tessaracoccus defluvii TaxID=1285901 RepID=A0A7H0H657_9ACTN|nr:glycoside hydrolase family 3 N-terminal domain-containing protein [Tessaracoccus defluvii]QNP56023.1 glycoside hydrolase family 3 C-terminal domain-containing protein [Tessaracoccus defluvii]
MLESAPWRDPSRPIPERVELLLGRLTLAEKIGQLGSVWPQPPVEGWIEGGNVAPMQDQFSDADLPHSDRIAHGLGHITRAYGTRPVSPALGARLLEQLQREVVSANRFGIPAIAHEECLTGFAAYGATVYPAPLAWAAAFDPDTVLEMASAIAEDLRGVGVHHGLAPVLDVVRDYRWGRVEETLGEDPYLVSSLAVPYVKGLEQGGIIATLKHFAGYSASRGGRNHAPVSVGGRELADVFLPPFEAALVEGGARSVMNSYTDVDGVPVAASSELLTDLLRDTWGFEGTVVSDYWAVPFLRSMHATVADDAAAGVAALRAGIDVELPYTVAYSQELTEAVETGQLPIPVVDNAVRRVLTQKIEAGLLDRGVDLVPAGAGDVELDSARNRAIARRLAERSVVLLQNDQSVLPLTQSPAKVAVIGPSWDDPRNLLGCYAFPNHVLSKTASFGLGVEIPTIGQALMDRLPSTEFECHAGVSIAGSDASGIPDAVEAARNADLVFLVLGDRAGLFGAGTSGEGCDAPDLSLPGRQAQLAEAVLATGTPVILIMVSGRPYAIGELSRRSAAALQVFFPGEEGAEAIADVITGITEPSGRLPVQIPGGDGASRSTYLQPRLGGRSEGATVLDNSPAYPFGHGLGYGTVSYESASLAADEIPIDGTLSMSVVLRNHGTRPTTEVVQLYATDPIAQVVRPLRWLVGFQRVVVPAESSVEIAFEVPTDLFSFTGLKRERIVEPGVVTLTAARSAADTGLPVSAQLLGAERAVPHRRRFFSTSRTRVIG